MEVVNPRETEMRSPELMKKIDEGYLFIHPTDTIYGIGCNALNERAVAKVREVKQRKDMPLSVIAPSKEWIMQNCIITPEAQEYIDQLPGPLTLILQLKNKAAVAKNVNLGGTLGVRLPKHWISAFVRAYGEPIITTSANVTGKEFMTSLEDLDTAVRVHMAFCLYEGEKKGKASAIVHLEGESVKVKRR